MLASAAGLANGSAGSVLGVALVRSLRRGFFRLVAHMEGGKVSPQLVQALNRTGACRNVHAIGLTVGEDLIIKTQRDSAHFMARSDIECHDLAGIDRAIDALGRGRDKLGGRGVGRGPMRSPVAAEMVCMP